MIFSKGKLKISSGISNFAIGINNRTFLPLSEDTCNDAGTRKCFFAGEHRTSENLGLVGVQTLFNREHNRIATELARINSAWNDEKLFMETRRIVVALLQHIVYNEWLPNVIGKRNLAPSAPTNAYYQGYDANVNPAIANEFAAGAFRFGHSLIIDNQARNDFNHTQINRNVNFGNLVFKTDLAYE